jgi:hypothetical protein
VWSSLAIEVGYEIFLSYFNYGNRQIRMRLPSGLPFAKRVWSRYIGGEGLQWTADKTGCAGILTLAPYLDEVDNEAWDFEDYLDEVARLREILIVGDFRALYLLWQGNRTFNYRLNRHKCDPELRRPIRLAYACRECCL